MTPLPIQYLHLETGVLPIFLAMMIWTQLARATEGSTYTQAGRTQAIWLSIGFGLLTIAFGGLLYNVSPLLAVELAAGIVLSLLHPVNALCFFVHMLILRPWEIVIDNPLLLALPRLLALLCFISWLIHPGQHARPSRSSFNALGLLLVFSVWLFLSTFQSSHVAETQADWFNTYFKSLIVFVMCLFFIESERSISEFELTLVISALALMAVGIYQYFSVGVASGRLETFGMMGNSNDLAAVIVMVIPFALLSVFSQGTNLVQQTGGLFFSGVAILVVWFTRSRGALLALVTQFLTFRISNNFRKSWLSVLLLTGLLGIGYLQIVRTMPRSQEDLDVSAESRVTFWKAAVNMTLHHPVFGVGFDEFPANFDSYTLGKVYSSGRRAAHSSWLLAFAESGVMGGLLYVTFFLTVLRIAWRNRKRWPAQFYAVVGYGAAMTFLSHTYLIYPYILSGLILASNFVEIRTPHEL